MDRKTIRCLMDPVKALSARFLRDRRGVSAMEFALVAPLMVSFFIGTVEVTNALIADRRVTSVASSVADLVAQAQSVTDEEMEDIFTAAGALMAPRDISAMKIVVTSVVQDNSGNAEVDWSEAKNGEPYSTGSSFLLPDGLIGPGTSVIVAEVEYEYTSPMGMFITDPLTVKDRFYMRPRRSSQVVRPNS